MSGRIAHIPGYDYQDLRQERALAAFTAPAGLEALSVRRNLIDLLKSARSERSAALNTGTELRTVMHPSWTDDHVLEARALVADLKRLPKHQARTLLLFACGFRQAEIALLEDVTVKTVDSRLFRARRTLRQDA